MQQRCARWLITTITGAVLDGPLAFDDAISLAAARIKGIHSPVSGKADILVVPDLLGKRRYACQATGIPGRCLQRRYRAQHQVPIVLTSRADSREARIASCAIAALVAHHYRVTPP